MTAWPHIYVHVPFCGRRCSYCDFAIAVRRDIPIDSYIDAILAEVVTRRVSTSAANLRSLYLGGGTPSKLGGAGIRRLIHMLGSGLGFGQLSTSLEITEVTVEANPEDVSPEVAADWVAAGVNRVSLGVQSFDPKVLEWMHRGHGPERVAPALQSLRSAGIQEVSIDLIFSVPEHLGRSWTRDLEMALELDTDHISVYGLTVEPHTPLGRWAARGEVAESPEESYEAEFLEAHERLGRGGFEHYEVSNYAKPGRRARHNSAYWSGAAYLGLGPSAHGFDGRERRWNEAAYTRWQQLVQGGVDPVVGQEAVRGTSDAELAREVERVYLGLRTIDGLEIRQNERMVVTEWVRHGWANLEGNRVVLTPAGWLRLDALASALVAG